MEPSTLHRRLVALLVGVLVAGLVVVGTFAVLPSQSAHDESVDCGYVYSGDKSSSVAFVRANLRDDSLLMLGSSEFSTPARTVPQVPVEVFGTHNYGLRPMLVGEAFDQCLWDVIALGAFANGGLPRNKVVLTVGLGQFGDGGLDPSTFQTRFSYTLYQEFCRNAQLSENTRSYVRNRLAQMGVDETTLRSAAPANPLDAIDGVVLGALDDLKLRRGLADVRSRGIALADGPVEEPNWDELRAWGLADAQRMSTTNDWGAEDRFWTEQLEPALAGLAGARAEETYTNTPEYDDLDWFLRACEECGVEALVVVCPSMGPYYDHIGISAQTRQAAYQRIRDVVAKHASARLADFSDREYEKYFLFDIVHFGWTGWVDVEHAVYDFAMEVA